MAALKKHIAQLWKKEETMNEVCEAFYGNSSGDAQCLTKDDIRELREYSSLAGNVKLVFGKFMPTPRKLNTILEGISHVGAYSCIHFVNRITRCPQLI
jgi:hypothetical protein